MYICYRILNTVNLPETGSTHLGCKTKFFCGGTKENDSPSFIKTVSRACGRSLSSVAIILEPFSLTSNIHGFVWADKEFYLMKLMLQIGLVFGICLFGQIISVFLPIAVPGSVISMILLFLLLFFKVLEVDHIRQKADFLLKNMAFFFIPAGIGIIADFSSIKGSILPLLAVVVLTTILTFGATAVTVQGVIALQSRFGKRKVVKSKRRKPRHA